MSYFPEISQRLAALSGSATPLEVRQALNEFDVRDINAVSVSEGGLPGPPAPGAVRMLDLGTVTLTNLASGPPTLYTPTAGEVVGPVLLRDIVFMTDGGAFMSLVIVGTAEPENLAGWDSDLNRDGAGYAASPLVGQDKHMPTTTGPVVATIATSGATAGFTTTTWQANQAVDGNGFTNNAPNYVLESGHVWNTADTGTTGGSKPNFAANIGGTVADNGLTWTDQGVFGDGSAHIYAYVSIPDTP